VKGLELLPDAHHLLPDLIFIRQWTSQFNLETRRSLALTCGLLCLWVHTVESLRGLVSLYTPFRVKEGDRIAQLICEPFVPPELTEVDHLDEASPPILVIDQTEQGSRVFDQDRVTRIATDLEAAELLEKTISE
jgi:hypothetical protein